MGEEFFLLGLLSTVVLLYINTVRVHLIKSVKGSFEGAWLCAKFLIQAKFVARQDLAYNF